MYEVGYRTGVKHSKHTGVQWVRPVLVDHYRRLIVPDLDLYCVSCEIYDVETDHPEREDRTLCLTSERGGKTLGWT
jgi:hypothetical protein